MRTLAATIAFAAALSAQPALAGFVPQGAKLIGNNLAGAGLEGGAVALSADGNTAIVGGKRDAPVDSQDGIGAAWVFTRSNGVWAQQGIKLVATGVIGSVANQGVSVSLSADGNTAIVGGEFDNTGRGAAWIFVRSNGVWQQTAKLVGSGAFEDQNPDDRANQGNAVALSGDGNTALVAGYGDNFGTGAVWVFVRNGNGTWTQQGNKLLVAGNVGNANAGTSVALSFDGNTAIFGGPNDHDLIGAAWIFTRSNGIWTQFGNKLVGNGVAAQSPGPFPREGFSVAISADGKTAVMGGFGDNESTGATWVFAFNNGVWSQQGDKLIGNGTAGGEQGWSVSISSDGNLVLVGGPADTANTGAAWLWARSNAGAWGLLGKLVGTGPSGAAVQGSAVAVSADGSTVLVGGPGDGSQIGATWPFVQAAFHDLNMDGKSDIVWRNSDGTLALWEMGGAQVTQSAAIGGVGTNWQLVAQRDFNRDFKTDLLWRDSTTGTVALWEMNGLQVAQSGAIAAVPGNWSIVGVADNCGCGQGILWRDASSGTLALWVVNGFTVTQTGSFGTLPANWSVAAMVGGFIFFRDSTTGTLVAWVVTGLNVLGTINYGVVPTNWSLVGFGDFNGDGSADLLWRDNTGATAVWLMSGFTVGGTGGFGTVPPNWIVAETGDFNGDGYADILWRDTSTGTAVIWFMHGLSVSSTVNLGVVPTSWTVQGTNAD